MGSKHGAVVRALTSHQCSPGLNPGVNAICGLSLLLVLSLIVLRGFSLLQVCFTACHSGKLLLVCSSPRVFLSSPKMFFISSIDYSSSVIWISQKTSLRASWEQNSPARLQNAAYSGFPLSLMHLHIWLLTQTKKPETQHICFPLPCFSHAPYGQERSENHGGQREQVKAGWIPLSCLQILFVLACFWSIEPHEILWYQSKRK